jgi:hypothetical protein
MGKRPVVFVDGVKQLWLELEQVKRTTPRYKEVMKQIQAESLAYIGHSSMRSMIWTPRQNDVDRRQIDRREIIRRK